jgi:hypothetical protein
MNQTNPEPSPSLHNSQSLIKDLLSRFFTLFSPFFYEPVLSFPSFRSSTGSCVALLSRCHRESTRVKTKREEKNQLDEEQKEKWRGISRRREREDSTCSVFFSLSRIRTLKE